MLHPTIPLLLALATASPGASPAPARPSFSATDEQAAAQALLGTVSRGSARRPGYGSGRDETVPGFLDEDGTLYEVLLSQTYEEAGRFRHAFVLGGHVVIDGEISDAHGQTTQLAAAVLVQRAGRWTLAARDAELSEAGSNGYSPGVSLRATGTLHAIEVASGWAGQGYSSSTISLYEVQDAAFRPVLLVAVEASDCGVDEANCFSYEGSLSSDGPAGPDGRPELRLSLKGTYRNASGKRVAMPGAPLVLRFRDGAYRPADPGVTSLWKALTNPQ